MSWRDLPVGGIILEAGNSVKRKTGDWRVFKPIIDQDKCTRCLLCWMYCPDGVIIIRDSEYRTSSGRVWRFSLEIDYDYCKGCGICVEECPIEAISFIEEVK
ncbi:MAG: 4Fe-4S binding protein [Acidilobaceae archaeon]